MCLQKAIDKETQEDAEFFNQMVTDMSHWKIHQRKQFLKDCRKIEVSYGQTVIPEGTANDFVYIVKSGAFKGYKKLARVENSVTDKVKDFLCGHTTKSSLRGVFNNKLKTMT